MQSGGYWTIGLKDQWKYQNCKPRKVVRRFCQCAEGLGCWLERSSQGSFAQRHELQKRGSKKYQRRRLHPWKGDSQRHQKYKSVIRIWCSKRLRSSEFKDRLERAQESSFPGSDWVYQSHWWQVPPSSISYLWYHRIQRINGQGSQFRCCPSSSHQSDSSVVQARRLQGISEVQQ